MLALLLSDFNGVFFGFKGENGSLLTDVKRFASPSPWIGMVKFAILSSFCGSDLASSHRALNYALDLGTLAGGTVKNWNWNLSLLLASASSS